MSGKSHIVKREFDYVVWKEMPNSPAWTAMAYQTWHNLTGIHLREGEIRRVNVTVSDDG